MTTLVETLTFVHGCYPSSFHPSTAGSACDACWYCQRSPEAGETVWFNCYVDLVCDPCARQRAAKYRPEEWAGDLEPESSEGTDNTVTSLHGLKVGDILRLDDAVTTCAVAAVDVEHESVDLLDHADGKVVRKVRVTVSSSHSVDRVHLTLPRSYSVTFQKVQYPRHRLPVFAASFSTARIMRRSPWRVPVRRDVTVKPFGIGDWLEVHLGPVSADGHRAYAKPGECETVPAQVWCEGWVVAVTSTGRELVEVNRRKGEYIVCGRPVRRIGDPFEQMQI